MQRVADLLGHCEAANHWANRGPLYHRLAGAYAEHLGIGDERSLTPCANGAIALEAMSRVLGMQAGRKLRWVGSAFSFRNLGRGHFSDTAFVDCDARGLLDLDALDALDPSGYDGIVLVNPFGLYRDFPEHIAYAKEHGKHLLIDNAAGLGTSVPDWPWQSFSLHHTKPYGVGEGGLALTPTAFADPLYALLDYGTAPADPSCWLTNGKISDIACAFLIDRLERADRWRPLYRKQAARVDALASALGLVPLCEPDHDLPATSRPYRSASALPLELLPLARHLSFGKYYKPLARLERTRELYDHLVNIPTHPGVSSLSDEDLMADLAVFAAPCPPLAKAVGR